MFPGTSRATRNQRPGHSTIYIYISIAYIYNTHTHELSGGGKCVCVCVCQEGSHTGQTDINHREQSNGQTHTLSLTFYIPPHRAPRISYSHIGRGCELTGNLYMAGAKRLSAFFTERNTLRRASRVRFIYRVMFVWAQISFALSKLFHIDDRGIVAALIARFV